MLGLPSIWAGLYLSIAEHANNRWTNKPNTLYVWLVYNTPRKANPKQAR